MPSQAITINSTAWTPITEPGKDATCWLIKEPQIGRLLVDHSDTGTGSLSFNKAYSIPSNKEVINDLIADTSNDIYYARCSRDGEEGILVVDDSPNVSAKISTDNSTSTPLGIAGTFIGQWFDVKNFGIGYVSVYSNVASALDGLEIQQSIDGINADHIDNYTIPAAIGKNFAINLHAQFIRIVYTNGPIAQTEFRLQLKINVNGLASSHRIQDSISTDDDARLVKSVITGQNPFGTFVNFNATRLGNFKVSIDEYGDTASIDAFGRLRVSEPYTLFDSKQLHDKQPLFWSETIGGAATSTHVPADAATVMSVTASASDYVIRQTKQRFNYQPGKSHLVLFTFHAPQQTGARIRMGAFDGTGVNYLTPRNGVFLEITGSDIKWNIAKNGTVVESVSQTDWNYDVLDGTGPSGLTLDISAVEIALLDIEWLGVGRCRVGFQIRGLTRYVHYFYHSNLPAFTSVYMSTPNLPLRYSIEGTGTATATLDHICTTVISEGGIQETGVLRSVNTGTTHIDANAADTKYAVIAIRQKALYYDITVYPETFSMVAETNDDYRWTIEINPTIAGTLTFNGVTDSAIEFALGNTTNTVTTTGIVVDSGFSKAATAIDRIIRTALRLGSTISGTIDILVLTVTPLSSNADFQASLTIRELL